MKNIVILSRNTMLPLMVVYAAKAAGYRVFILADKPLALKFSRYVKQFTQTTFPSADGDVKHFQQKIQDYCKKYEISTVSPSCMSTAKLLHGMDSSAELTIFPVSAPELLDFMHDKWEFAKFLGKNNIATPKTVLINSLDDFEKYKGERNNYPVMVKPLNAQSSHGVVKMDNERELEAHLVSGGNYAKMPLIIQNYLPGRDIGVSIFAMSGRVKLYSIQCWEKTVTDRSMYFVKEHAALLMAQEIASITGYNGVAHFDFREDLETGRLQVLECNPRFWFSLNASLWQGANFVDGPLRLLEKTATEQELMSNYREGRYYLNMSLIKSLPFRIFSLTGLTISNLRSYFQVISDPLPFLAKAIWRIE